MRIRVGAHKGIRTPRPARRRRHKPLVPVTGPTRLPERVDAVMDSVGAATWSHSINVLKPGGTLVICGATSGDNPPKAELTKIYFKPLRVIGSTMGTRDELISLTQMLVATGLRPHIDRVLPLADAASGFAAMIAGDHFGKIVLQP